jgi:hypothetical protein
MGLGCRFPKMSSLIAAFPQSNFSGSLEILPPLCCGLLLGRTGLWLTNEALEQSARAGMSLGTCLFEFGGFVRSTGAAAVLTDA